MENIKKNKNRFIYFSICVFIFILILFINLFYISHKVGLHVDETLTFATAQDKCVNDFIQFKIPTGYYYGRTIKSVLIWDKSSLHDVLSDVKTMRNNGINSGHSILYFTLLRLWSTGHDVDSVDSCIFIGTTLNLVFLLITYIFMCKLLAKLFENNFYRSLGLIAAFLNTAVISNVLFIRPYYMQMMMLTILSYYFVNLMMKMQNEDYIYSSKNIIGFGIVSVFSLLSGYLGIIYISFLWSVLLLKSNNLKLWSTNKKKLAFISSLFLLIPIVSPKFWVIFSKGGLLGDILQNLSFANYQYNFMCFLKNGLHDLIYYYFYVPIFIVFLYIILTSINNRRINLKLFFKELFGNSNKLPLLLFIISIIWIFVIMWLLPVKSVRYYMVIYPVMSVFIPYLCLNYKNGEFKKQSKILGIIFGIIFLLGALFPKNVTQLPFSYSKVNYLYQNQKRFFEALTETKLPIVINEDFMQKKEIYIFKYAVIPYLKDSEKYAFNIPTDKLPEKYIMLYSIQENNNPIFYAVEIENGILKRSFTF